MATGTAGSTARRYHQTMVHYLRKDFDYTVGDDATITVGIIPKDGVVIEAGVVISTAFNFGTNNRLDIGTSDDTDGFATLLACGTIGRIVADEMATSNDLGPYTADTTIVGFTDFTGSAASAGKGHIYVFFTLPDKT